LPPPPEWLTSRRIMFGSLLFGLALRLIASVLIAAGYFDEIFQYLEPAYHLTGGAWVIPWDQRSGIRSWLLPLVLAGPMALGRAIRDDPATYVTVTRAAMSLLSLLVIAAAVRLGECLSRWHALFAGIVAATWFELINFAPRTLSEAVALSLFMGAVLLLQGTRTLRFGHWAGAGLFLGFSFLARFQYAPAIAVLAIGTARLDWRRAWLPLIAGGGGALVIGAGVDMAFGQVPLHWLVKNITMNVVEDRSALYGTRPVWAYASFLLYNWLVALLPISFLFILGARRYPVLAAAAIVHLAAHSLIAHKEYRFGLVAVALIVILAAIGSADLLARVPLARVRRMAFALLTGWIVTSVALAISPTYRSRWAAFGSLETLTAAAGRDPRACGLAVFAGPTLGAAYVFYNRSAPIYAFVGPGSDDQLRRSSGSSNAAIAFRDSRPLLDGFVMSRCQTSASSGERCLFIRPGSCRPQASMLNEINSLLVRNKE